MSQSTIEVPELIVRGNVPVVLDPGNMRQMEILQNGDLPFSPNLPPRALMMSAGRSWGATIANANAFTTVAAYPTTLSALQIYNGEPQGTGRTYIIDRIWFLATATQAAAESITLLAQNVPKSPKITVPTDGTTTVLRRNLAGNRITYRGQAILTLAATSMIADQWTVVGQGGVNTANTANIGQSAAADCCYLVPPGGLFGVNAIVSTAAATSAIMGIEWHEVQLPLAD